MTKKLFAFASAAVFSFGMAVASTEVATPVVANNQEMVTALIAANEAVAKLNAQEVEAIVQALKKDGSVNNDVVNALLDQAQALSGTSITLGMVAAVVVAYYALPAIYRRFVAPTGSWMHKQWTTRAEARAEAKRQRAVAAQQKQQ